MRGALLISLVWVVLGCGPSSSTKTCRDTGCPAGSTCDAPSGRCTFTTTDAGEVADAGRDAGASIDAGATFDAGRFDAGLVDPFDDGGVFQLGDICSVAVVIDFDGGSLVTATANLTALGDEYRASCGSESGSGGDMLFEVHLDDVRQLTVSALGQGDAGTQDPAISLLEAPCVLDDELACFNESAAGDEVLVMPSLDAGVWFVRLDSADSTTLGGAFEVRFELSAPVDRPVNDQCLSAEPLVFVDGFAQAHGSTSGAFNDTVNRPSRCASGTATSGEVFYSFTLDEPHDVELALTDVTEGFLPVATLHPGCGAAERSCTPVEGQRHLVRNLAAGTWVVAVDAASAKRGDFTLEVTLSAPTVPPANDRCDAAATLAPNTTVMVNAGSAERDEPGSCAPSATGGDVLYAFTLAQPQQVRLTATGMSSGSDSVLAVRQGTCEDEHAELACVDDEGAGPESLHWYALPAGTYYVVLSAFSSVGAFALALETSAPVFPPANDACGAPATLVPGVAQTIDLSAANHDVDLSCTVDSGPDAVYAFTLTQLSRITLTVTGTSGSSNPAVAVLGQTCAPGAELRCTNVGSGAGESLVLNSLAAGTYYVALASDQGPHQYGLELELSAPIVFPNDTCATASQVTFVNDLASASVDLADAASNISVSSEACDASGPDAVWSVDIPMGKSLTVDVVGPSPVDTVVYVRDVCTMGPAVICVDDDYGDGFPETVTVDNSTGTATRTVFVIVKAYGTGSTVGPVTVSFALN